MSSLRQIVERFREKKVVVFGDMIADVFLYGEISRISREAPVLVLNHRETVTVPGGGANAVHNICALGGIAIPVGVVGHDAEGRALVDHFAKMGVSPDRIGYSKNYRTPAKMRILAGAVHSQRQQIVRVDYGDPLRDEKDRRVVEDNLKAVLKEADAFLVSDYGYGLTTPEIVSKMTPHRIPSTIDSRFSLMNFSGLTAATPNESEVEAALGISIGKDTGELETAGRSLLRKLKHDALLITRGKHGMALFERGKKTAHIPVHGSDEVTDVTGAGDTVIATFTLALAAGASYYDAARLANYAGGIVVMKYGTRPVTFDELLQTVDRNSK
jgi:rfaE bifunctional protein kinase chain/domain